MKHGPVLDFPVQDKIVLVTGGGSGIGFAFARLCHQAGARIVLGDLRCTPEAQQYLDATSDKSIVFQKCDVTKWNDLHDLITASVTAFGQVPDVYAPVAGIYEPEWSNFWDDETEGFYKTIQINVNHPLKLTRLAIRALVGAQKQGVVCLVASTAGIRPNYLAALYVSSKHAIVGFAKSMGPADADEGVRVVCILPGLVDSPLWRDRTDQMLEQNRFHDRQAIYPEDVAHVMKKMVEEKRYVGGTCVVKSAQEETVLHDDTNDPSPRPAADLHRIESVLEKERGRPWS